MNDWTSRGVLCAINWRFHMIFGGFLLSSMLGSILCSLYPAWKIWETPFFTQGMGVAFPTFTMSDLLLRLCIFPILWMVLIVLSGISLAGVPISGAFFLLRASALGAALTHLYAHEGVRGFTLALFFVMPYAMISSILYILGIREASGFSLSLLRLLREGKKCEISVRLYLMRFLALCLMMILVGIIQCIWLKYVYSDIIMF